ncbi:hypothetical protein Tco_0370597 [Tanacetum coccineum]
MGDENPIRALEDYSRPSHEGYRNTIELPDGNNVVPLRSDTIRQSLCLKKSLVHPTLMEADLAPKSSVQVNKITSSCKIYSGPHDTQYFMENPKQAFVDYASSCTNEAGGKCWGAFAVGQPPPEEGELEAWIFDVALESLHQFFMVMQLWDNYYFEFRKSTNSSSPKRVYFINSIPILNKEDEPRDAGIVKPDTKNDDHDIIVKVENETEEEREGKK